MRKIVIPAITVLRFLFMGLLGIAKTKQTDIDKTITVMKRSPEPNRLSSKMLTFKLATGGKLP